MQEIKKFENIFNRDIEIIGDHEFILFTDNNDIIINEQLYKNVATLTIQVYQKKDFIIDNIDTFREVFKDDYNMRIEILSINDDKLYIPISVLFRNIKILNTDKYNDVNTKPIVKESQLIKYIYDENDEIVYHVILKYKKYNVMYVNIFIVNENKMLSYEYSKDYNKYSTKFRFNKEIISINLYTYAKYEDDKYLVNKSQYIQYDYINKNFDHYINLFTPNLLDKMFN